MYGKNGSVCICVNSNQSLSCNDFFPIHTLYIRHDEQAHTAHIYMHTCTCMQSNVIHIDEGTSRKKTNRKKKKKKNFDNLLYEFQ